LSKDRVCAEWPAYGYRRVTAELHDEGRIVNHKKVMRLMKENGLTVRPRRHFMQRPTAITMGRSSRTSPRTLCQQT
jgi:transposase InsO family protein